MGRVRLVGTDGKNSFLDALAKLIIINNRAGLQSNCLSPASMAVKRRILADQLIKIAAS